MLGDRAAVIGRVLQTLRSGGRASAADILHAEYPFISVTPEDRRYTELLALQVFRRDGFVDRYSGQRLVFPGVLRLLSAVLPQEFPFHPNWKMTETHPAYWELFPTIDHVLPVSRGGVDSDVNWVTTSMVRNAAKANWTLEELGWGLCPPGSLVEWDGLTGSFLEFVDSDRSVLGDGYLRRWYSAVVRMGLAPNS
ncbi:MAG: HNH endonuclease [Planctomycetes bacterium]|nr:HNH endonuclease [Planctomycetota bacterium]